MKTIPLTRGLSALVDDADYAKVASFRWQAHRSRSSGSELWYASNPTLGLMHRFLLGAADGVEVDHRNQNSLDNRRENIRVATRAQQMANRRCYNSTGFKGIQEHKTGFAAYIGAKRRYLGFFPTAELAARAYDRAAIELYGEFACLNFPHHPLSQAA